MTRAYRKAPADREESYVYVLTRKTGPKAGEAFYVGKGYGQRCKLHFGKRCHNKQVAAIIAKAGGAEVEFVYMGITDTQAKFYERCVIADIGRLDKGKGPLVNHTDGGDGTRGNVKSEETLEKLKAAAEARAVDLTWLQNNAAACAARRGDVSHSANTKAGIARRQANAEASEYYSAKLSAAQKAAQDRRVPGLPPVAERCRGLITEGLNNAAIWAIVQPEYDLPNKCKHHPGWYRRQIERDAKKTLSPEDQERLRANRFANQSAAMKAAAARRHALRPTPQGRCREMIIAGSRTDEQILAAVNAEFPQSKYLTLPWVVYLRRLIREGSPKRKKAAEAA